MSRPPLTAKCIRYTEGLMVLGVGSLVSMDPQLSEVDACIMLAHYALLLLAKKHGSATAATEAAYALGDALCPQAAP